MTLTPDQRTRLSKHYRWLALEAVEADDRAGALAAQVLTFKQYRLMQRAVVRILVLVVDEAHEEAARAGDAAAELLLDELAADWSHRVHQRIREAYEAPAAEAILRAGAVGAGADGAGAGGAGAGGAGSGPLTRRGELAALLTAALAGFDEAQERDAAAFQRAVAGGHRFRARAVLEQRRQNHRRLHDIVVDAIAEGLSAVYTLFGEERFYALLRATGEDFSGDFHKWAQLSPEQLVDASVFMQMCHPDTELEVDEDEDRYVIRQHCGSGGRLIAEGRFDGPDALARVGGAGPASLGRPGIPTYCAHCTVWNTVMTNEREGQPVWVIDHPHDSSCTISIYKRRDRIPAAYLRAIAEPPVAAADDRSHG